MKVLYVNGCSYTAGSETVDHTVFSDWPGYSINGNNDARGMEWFRGSRAKQLDAIYKKDGLEGLLAFKELERSHAWPSHLGKLLDVAVVNDSMSGSSQEKITLSSIEGLTKLLKTYAAKDITAIIQLTSPYRALYPNFDSLAPNDIEPFSSVLASESYQGDSKRQLAQQAFSNWPFKHMELKYAYDINHLINYCIVNDINVKILYAWPIELSHILKEDMYHVLIEKINKHNIADNFYFSNMEMFERDSQVVKITAPGLHPIEESHIKLATFIEGIIKNG